MEKSTIQLLKYRDSEITNLNIKKEKIKGLLDLEKFNQLIRIDCSINKKKKIFNFPTSLQELDCSYNKILNLDNLPKNLLKLYCGENQISEQLEILNCVGNKLNKLDNLPPNITDLDC
jgi:hypothetical protein